jgi:hypothetical protein
LKLRLGKNRVLVVSDLQCPFEHEDALEFVNAVKVKYATDRAVFIGDEVDFHAFAGKFPHDPDGKSAGDELSDAELHLKPWYESFPLAEVCLSNHLERIYKKAYNAGFPKRAILAPRELLRAPETWRWERSFTIDSVKYEHGDSQGGLDAARLLAIANRQSTVIGHHHAHGGVRFLANDNEMIFGMNVGCLINRHAYAFAYGLNNKFKPTLGCGVVIYGAPYFVPMIVSGKNERWIKEII